MPEITFPSEWLKIDVNVKAGDSILFKDTGTFDSERESWNFVVEIIHNGEAVETKKFTLNKTNHKVVSGLYGTNSDGWLGKQMVVTKIKARKPDGTPVDSILLEAPSADVQNVQKAGI